MKKTFLSMVLAVASMSTQALPAASSLTPDDGQHAIVIHQRDGKVARFLFSEKPVVTCSGNDLMVSTTKTSVQYPIYLLQKISFDVDWSVVGIPEMKTSEAHFHFQGDALTISGGEPGSTVLISDMRGIVVGRHRLDTQGYAVIPLHLPGKQLYIVKTSQFSFKFHKP